jgi:hypothetical protein
MSFTNRTTPLLNATPPTESSKSVVPARIFRRDSRVINGPFSTFRVALLERFPSAFSTTIGSSAARAKNVLGTAAISAVEATNLVSII